MTERLTPDEIGRAVELLRAGELVAFGTETVYGLGADARNGNAVAAVYAAKGRPSFNPLICHFASAATAFRYVKANALAEKLAAKFWPGPLTLVLPRQEGCPVSQLAGAGLATLAVRVPAQPVALTLLEAFGGPVVGPSANRSGRISPTTAQHVLAELGGRIAAVLDSGACPVGVESTVLDLSGETPVLLRPGGVTLEALEAEIGPIARAMGEASAPASPGMLASHYAPGLQVRLNATEIGADEALLAFGPPLAGAKLCFQLSASGDLREAAARLFEGLHELDDRAQALGLRCIAVQPIPATGLGLAINDRLNRAAAPR
ncbi:L-threonylcarbamoyladenylate synthase [Acidocella aromatica]|uniref:Threonylcarbamoyl-AMP synthase n=1 Tax=Acidocella aromatica TaxID=1303579 RepID=A0A840VET0_9PROT|nr:L-threonylcarbamoyladenylate synthase [Acidocella aromatica]MBB5374196.1 L-threonylcarbamoyladenylate synthase [Acidocella aromatica]